MTDKSEKQDIKIDIDSDTAKGVYSNLTICQSTPEEVILDFALIDPQIKRGKIQTRVILSPNNAKRLAEMLTKQHGSDAAIGPDESPSDSPSFHMNFN